MKRSVIFDLDLTLVDSSIAEDARKSRNWGLVYSLISKFRMYNAIREVCESIRSNNMKVAIVSTAPRPYLERVCKFLIFHMRVLSGIMKQDQ